ncbi:MAG: hypothetical protein C4547_06665 [Phycisphaerales bacterium]|nr:MAG: hypothetical protein C4547_06665 [Phycisphaerales bacterium]
MIGAVSLWIPVDALDGCVWELLRRSVCRTPQRGGGRLAISDSKRLFGRQRGLAALERPVLAVLAAWGRPVSTWRELLSVLAPAGLAPAEQVPWYRGDFALPLDPHTGDMGTRATPLTRDLDAHHIAIQAIECEVLDAGEFNRRVQRSRNKASVEMDAVFRLMASAFDRAGGRPVRLVSDRLGGRTRYRDALLRSFPEFALQIDEEGEARSRYTLRDGDRVRRIEFHADGEQVSLPTALASMCCKYVRECFMHAFNRYWTAQVPGLTPTAGYYTDAQRFLRETESARRRLAVPNDELIRQR